MENNKTHYDVIVIGGGPIGLSTAYHLSKRNTRTLVLEQFTFFNQLGSSAGVSRQFRIPYPEEYMVKLVKQSIPFWDELQSLTPTPLRDKVGTLWFGDPAVHSTEGNIGEAEKSLTAAGVTYQQLSGVQVEKQRRVVEEVRVRIAVGHHRVDDPQVDRLVGVVHVGQVSSEPHEPENQREQQQPGAHSPRRHGPPEAAQDMARTIGVTRAERPSRRRRWEVWSVPPWKTLTPRRSRLITTSVVSKSGMLSWL